MNRHFYLIPAQTLILFLVCGLSAQISDVVTTSDRLSSDIIEQEQSNQAAITLPLSPLIFTQETHLKYQLTPLLSYLTHNKPQKLSPEIQDYLNRTSTLEMIMVSYFLLFAIKSIIHCQIGQTVPSGPRYTAFDTHETNASTGQNWTVDGVEQKISIAEVIDLLEHVQSDLARINHLDRHDKKEIMKILLDREQQLKRKLKQLGILHYSSQSSFWNSSLLPCAVTGMFMGGVIFTLALASIDEDGVHVPSKTLLMKNLEPSNN